MLRTGRGLLRRPLAKGVLVMAAAAGAAILVPAASGVVEEAYAGWVAGKTGFPLSTERAQARIARADPPTRMSSWSADPRRRGGDRCYAYQRETRHWTVCGSPNGMVSRIELFVIPRHEVWTQQETAQAVRALIWVVAPGLGANAERASQAVARTRGFHTIRLDEAVVTVDRGRRLAIVEARPAADAAGVLRIADHP
jgi:hypothetical protein